MCCDKPVSFAGPLTALWLLAAPAAALEVVGTPEPVHESGSGCAPGFVADAPARAFRTADGVRLVAAHHVNHLFAGPDFDHLSLDCQVAFRGAENPDPGAFDGHAWIAATFTRDGRAVHALVHDEFHGHRRPDLCPAARYMACWYNRVTAALSEDGGRSFRRTGLVAVPPQRWDGGPGRHVGYFNPSNIVADGGWYYVTVFATQWGEQKPGNCLLRTDRPEDPTSWRAWDGKDFTVRFTDPYVEAGRPCEPVGPVRSPYSSIVRTPGGWLATFAGDGFYASTSPDLIAWSPARKFWSVTIAGQQGCGQPWSANYPALLDPDSPGLNFDTADGEAWLYYTRFWTKDCGLSMRRDLMRVKVRL